MWTFLHWHLWFIGSSDNNWPDNPKICTFSWGNWISMKCMVPWAHPNLPSNWHLDRFSRFCGAYERGRYQRHRQTAEPWYSMCSSRPQLAIAVMQLNNMCSQWLMRECRSATKGRHRNVEFQWAQQLKILQTAAEKRIWIIN